MPFLKQEYDQIKLQKIKAFLKRPALAILAQRLTHKRPEKRDEKKTKSTSFEKVKKDYVYLF